MTKTKYRTIKISESQLDHAYERACREALEKADKKEKFIPEGILERIIGSSRDNPFSN